MVVPGRPGTCFCGETVIPVPDEPYTDTIRAVPFEKTFPADLMVAAIWLAAVIMALYPPVLSETPVGVLLILPGMLFVPGYCCIAALFPKDRDIDLTERLVLSFGLSITVVPLIALILNFTPFGIRLFPVLITLALFTLAMILVARYRRSLLPQEKRFIFPFFGIASGVRNTLFPKEGNTLDRILPAAVAMMFIIAVLATIYVIAVPKEGEQFTEFFILGENRTATEYPDQINPGQDYPLYVGVANHEYRKTDYTIETWLTRTEFDPVTNTSHLIAMDPGDRLAVSLGHNETYIIPYNLSVKKTTYNRVQFLLFRDYAPGAEIIGNDRIKASYRNVNIWIRQE